MIRNVFSKSNNNISTILKLQQHQHHQIQQQQLRLLHCSGLNQVYLTNKLK
jgi:ABC-type proline/glycine betaine transport system ATPase subunit